MRKRLRVGAAALAAVLCLAIVADSGKPGAIAYMASEEGGGNASIEDRADPHAYSAVLGAWQDAGERDARQDAAAQDGPSQAYPDLLDWRSEPLTYTFAVAEPGLYQLELAYKALPGSINPVWASILVNGESPYTEARSIQLQRQWQDRLYPAEKDERGNSIRPQQVEVYEWTTIRVRDSRSAYAEPLRFRLSAGEHTITLQATSEQAEIADIRLVAPAAVPRYEELQSPQGGSAASEQPAPAITIEAEQMWRKSDPSVQMSASNDNLAVPRSGGRQVFNTMGGDRWRQGGQWAEWQFTVPADGVYEIYVKAFQGFRVDSTAFRRVELNGAVPFRELEAMPFTYSSRWQLKAIAGGEGEAYAFPLSAGTHTLRMEVTQAPLTPIIEAIQHIIRESQQLNRTLRLVTGIRNTGQSGAGDSNRDWNIESLIPGVAQQFAAMADSLAAALGELEAVYGKQASGEGGIRSAIADLRKLADKPNLLPQKPELLASVQETLGGYIDQVTSQPLAIDQLYIVPQGGEVPDTIPSRWDEIANTLRNFGSTFSKDYYYYGRQDEDAITVWVNRGRDYVALMQTMVDELFTPETGIKVNINLMPNPQLLILSKAAGREPDVALGLDAGTPVDFAMRNALLDLSSFADYEAIAARFHPGARLPFHYDGGDYALPETLSPSLMFIRTDIMAELKLEAPDTWDDIIGLLPTLQQKGYNFFMAPGNFVPYFYQRGVEFYANGGLSSGLASPDAYAAFKQWTDLFTVYGLDKEVPNFYMHFRNGDMPLGVADFNTYLQLLVAAPEIAGLWSIAPMPGINSGGGVERWSGGAMQAGVIFQSTEQPEAAWSFLKWWTSDEVQARFGTDIEWQNGVEFRWNTANRQAFAALPWPRDHAEPVLEQLAWFKEVPTVPGGYFTARELTFAWNRTVLEQLNFRDSLDQSIIEINREMLRKQQEFGLVDEQGSVQHRLSIPNVDVKWEGAGQP